MAEQNVNPIASTYSKNAIDKKTELAMFSGSLPLTSGVNTFTLIDEDTEAYNNLHIGDIIGYVTTSDSSNKFSRIFISYDGSNYAIEFENKSLRDAFDNAHSTFSMTRNAPHVLTIDNSSNNQFNIINMCLYKIPRQNNVYVGDFNAGNITEEGWYDAIDSGRPEGSESDEKYYLYHSANGGQICFSRRNSGKAYHRSGKEHPWVPLTHDDYSIENPLAALHKSCTLINTYGNSSISYHTPGGYTYDSLTDLTEYYAGNNNETRNFHISVGLNGLKPNDIIRVRCVYRRGFSAEGVNTYPYDSDAYMFVSKNSGSKDHSITNNESNWIKIKSMGGQNFPFTDGEKGWQNLAFMRDRLFDNDYEYSWHYIRVTAPQVGENNYLHIYGDFDKPGSWFVFDKAEVYRASNYDSIGIKNTTYSALKTLRDNSQLVPGSWYRITDYVTTTSATKTQSANHQFDVIVRADDVNILNENAYAAKHAGDTYFSNSKLEAWELKYSLDNDSSKFAWADSTNGKGVIYYMKDEFGNECPYDFKNIMFKRYRITQFNKCPSLFNTYSGIYVSPVIPNGSTLNLNNPIYRYTFDYLYGTISCYDLTVYQCTQTSIVCYNNIINGHYSSKQLRLNNIVIGGTSYNSCHDNTFGNNCYNNTFVNGCYSNTFGNSCYNNTFGNNCYSNTFRYGCHDNTFWDDCANNTFDDNSSRNIFQQKSNFNGQISSNVLFETDDIYQKKDSTYYPIAHPDLSTQPSILPQRFGNLPIKEVLITPGREDEIPKGAMVIEAWSFNGTQCTPAFVEYGFPLKYSIIIDGLNLRDNRETRALTLPISTYQMGNVIGMITVNDVKCLLVVREIRNIGYPYYKFYVYNLDYTYPAKFNGIEYDSDDIYVDYTYDDFAEDRYFSIRSMNIDCNITNVSLFEEGLSFDYKAWNISNSNNVTPDFTLVKYIEQEGGGYYYGG